jgi:hypothetical protein
MLTSYQFVVPANNNVVTTNFTSRRCPSHKDDRSFDLEVEKAVHSLSRFENNSVTSAVLSSRWVKPITSFDLRELACGRKRKRDCDDVETQQRFVNLRIFFKTVVFAA